MQGKEPDGVFAARLCISRPLWSMTKHGKANVSLSLLKGVIKAYPDMCSEVVKFLRDGEVND